MALDRILHGGSTTPVTVRRHQCPHCRRTWAKRPAAERHVARCFRNSAARACKTCALYEPGEPDDWISGYPGCRESCGAGHNLSDDRGLRVHCADWECIW